MQTTDTTQRQPVQLVVVQAHVQAILELTAIRINVKLQPQRGQRAWGSLGTNNGQFNKVSDVTVGSTGQVYVSDYGKNNVQVFGLI